MEVTLTWWLMFHAVIVVCLLIDLYTSKGKGKLTLRRDIIWSIIWISVGLSFGGIIYWQFGAEEGLKYLTAYVTEKALSVDNLFVFLVIFTYFSVPFERQHKVLIELFHPVIYVFGAILLFSGYKLFFHKGEGTNPGTNPVVGLCRRFLPLCDEYEEDKFITKLNGRTVFTPLLIVLLVVETTDIMFALDSVPAVLTITGEFFTAYTSNIMAILGLRALYFVLSHAMGELKYLSKGLAIVLVYLGAKTIGGAFGLEIPTLYNMAIVLGTLTFFVILSLINKDKPKKEK
jgi:tellurite resistance protein TerC